MDVIGSVVKDHSYLLELKSKHYPLGLDESLEAIEIIVNKVKEKLSE